MFDKSLELLKNMPKQKRSLELVLAIFESMDQLLSDAEIEKVSTNKVSEKAGVSIGSFYQYFKDKEQLLKAFLRNKFLAHQKLFLEKVEELSHLEPGEFIEGFCDYSYEYYNSNQAQLKMLYHRVGYLGQYEFMMEHRQEVVDKIQAYLERHKDKIDSQIDIEMGAAMMIQSAMGIYVNLSFYKEKDRILVDELKRSLKKYLLPKN